MAYKVDIAGKRFGGLLVRSYAGGGTWECVCDCGNTTIKNTGHLNAGAKSCGCIVTKDIHGKKFGRLTAIRENGRGNKGIVLWECVCDCGNTVTTRGSALRAGKVKSCGCFLKAKVYERGRTLSKQEWRRQYDRRGRKELSDRYVKALLCRHGLGFSYTDEIPPILIEIKRLQIQLKREVRNDKNGY
jgi:hypothetical protein